MDLDFTLIAKSLMTWTFYEKGRTDVPRTDLKNVAPFQSLDAIISHSLKAPNLVKTHTPAGNQMKLPQPMKRTFEDEEIVRKLIQYKDKIPLSARILRPGGSSS